MAAVRHMGFVGRLLVCIVLPNLVKINAVDLMTGNVQYFASLTFKTPIHDPEIGGLRAFYPQNGEQYERTPPKKHPCASPRRLSHQA